MSDPYSNFSSPEDPVPYRGEPARDEYGNALPQDTYPIGFDGPPKQFGPEEEVKGSVGLTVLAWGVIISLVTLLAGMNFYSQYFIVAKNTVASSAEKMTVNLQSKIMIGMPLFVESIGGEAPVADEDVSLSSLESINTGPPEIRFGYTVLVNEMIGPEVATKELAKLRRRMQRVAEETGGLGRAPKIPADIEKEGNEDGKQDRDDKSNEDAFQLTDTQRRVANELANIFEALSEKNFAYVDTLGAEKVELLTSELGWLGGLAAYPKGTARTSERDKLLAEARSTFAFGAIFFVGILVVGVGAVVTSLILFAMTAGGSLRFRFRTSNGRGGIYAETFAFWIVLFLCGSFSLAAVQSLVQLPSEVMMLGQLLIFFGSLFALVYPAVRGVPLDVMKQDIGFDFRNVIREVAMGFVGYLGIVPLVFAGLVMTAVTAVILSGFTPTPIHEFVSNGEGSHPIQDEIASGNLILIIGVFLTACVAAPIVEETVFRGVLYQHLRDSSRRIPRFISVLFSGAISSFVFAIIHPQGLLGVPVLMCLAFGFVLVREWRGSIVAPMTMHAIHNSIVTCVLLIAL